LPVGKVSAKLAACVLPLEPTEMSAATKVVATSFGHAAVVRRLNHLLKLTRLSQR